MAGSRRDPRGRRRGHPQHPGAGRTQRLHRPCTPGGSRRRVVHPADGSRRALLWCCAGSAGQYAWSQHRRCQEGRRRILGGVQEGIPKHRVLPRGSTHVPLVHPDASSTLDGRVHSLRCSLLRPRVGVLQHSDVVGKAHLQVVRGSGDNLRVRRSPSTGGLEPCQLAPPQYLGIQRGG